MPEFVYVLCLDPPRSLSSADCAGPSGDPRRPRSYPVSHYVGWTRQDWPMHRAGSHGAGMATCVLLMPGTEEDEERLKTAGQCPRCGGSLDYRAEAMRAGAADKLRTMGLM